MSLIWNCLILGKVCMVLFLTKVGFFPWKYFEDSQVLLYCIINLYYFVMKCCNSHAMSNFTFYFFSFYIYQRTHLHLLYSAIAENESNSCTNCRKPNFFNQKNGRCFLNILAALHCEELKSFSAKKWTISLCEVSSGYPVFLINELTLRTAMTASCNQIIFLWNWKSGKMYSLSNILHYFYPQS